MKISGFEIDTTVEAKKVAFSPKALCDLNGFDKALSIVVSPEVLAVIVKTKMFNGLVDWTTLKSDIAKGLLGSLFGKALETAFNDPEMPDNEFYFVCRTKVYSYRIETNMAPMTEEDFMQAHKDGSL
jgi:hypothetical protein